MSSDQAAGLQLYLTEAIKHKQDYCQQLDELRHDLAQGELRRRDYLAIERLLQVLTELCIGLAKHCVKKYQQHSAADAYQTFSQLHQHGFITADELAQWRQIIGMRNGLVHDYLNIDVNIISLVVAQGRYQTLSAFCDKATDFLRE
ncbi:MAG: type VII toxin-antitoxin system HepT family RNase toxin [Plesiomonas shigelloides]